MSLFYATISMRGEWKQRDENERIMQRNRRLAKYRICGFYFVHDLCMITFFQCIILQATSLYSPSLSFWFLYLDGDKYASFIFILEANNFFGRYGISLYYSYFT